MGKRRNRQPDVIDDGNSVNNVHLSESSEDASIGEFKCQHLQKAINSSLVRKLLKRNGIDTVCTACKSSNSNANLVDNEEESEIVTPVLWICLRCGNQACGRYQRSHAEEHFKRPHSDSHCIVMDTHRFSIHCYECDGDINPNVCKNLLTMVEFIKKLAITSTASPQLAIPLPSKESVVLNTYETLNETDKKVSMRDLTKVSGLNNYGNTCFFNSVLQCLAQTPYLVEVLQDLQEPGENFSLPGGSLKVSKDDEESDEQSLPSIAGTLEGWGSFTSILCKTLIEMQTNSDNKTHRPNELLSSFKKKTSQCMDGGQHDAHELLRHLLELVRNEDLKRYQSIILKEIGLNEKNKRKNIDSSQKAHVKFYGNQASARLLGPEPVFRGVLVSTLVCLQCNHSSQRTEPFLDLSLPVMVDKPQPPILKRKNCGLDENDHDIANTNVPTNPPPSKHHLKKKKISARSDIRRARRQHNRVSNCNNNDELLSNNSILEESQESNNDVINSDPDDESDADIEDNAEGELTSMPDVIESGYSSEKTAHPSPTELPTISPSNSSLMKTTFSEAETDECRSSPETEHPSCVSSIMKDIDNVTTGISKVSVTNQRALSSSPTRYPTVEGDFSIQSCLNQFTALELMSGSNKVGCEACTAREKRRNPDSSSSKMICTQSTKQYLISRVPPVLILHLKRFQSQKFGGFRKVTKHVTFPTVFDLSPVCKNHRKRKLYSLFGVVEHSGTLHGGHYVAYVKARPPLRPNDRRWSFLPKKGDTENDESKSSDHSDTESEVDEDSKTTVEPPPGQWYHISDSRVMAVDEATVLKQEAYLLFYERIL